MSEKRRQHERKIILLLAAACLVVWLAAAALLAAENREVEAPDAAVRTTLSVKTIRITDGDESFSMQKDKTTWECTSAGAPLNSTEVSVLASSFGDLTADRIIPDGREYFGQFGLDAPAFQIAAGGDAGEKVWNVGDYNPILGQYYVTVDEDDTIYLVPKNQMEKCMKTLLDLVMTPGLESMKSSDILQYEVIEGEESFLSETAENIFFALKNTAYDHCLTYEAGENDLKKYGLDQPDLEIRMTMADNTVLKVKIAEAGDGTAYLNAWDNSIVYQMAEDDLANLKEKIAAEKEA